MSIHPATASNTPSGSNEAARRLEVDTRLDQGVRLLIERMARRCGENRPEVLAACVVSLGSTGIHGSGVALSAIVAALEADRTIAPVPSVGSLASALDDSPLTHGDGSPFVVDSGRLYARRALQEERTLADGLRARVGSSAEALMDDAVIDALTSADPEDRQRRAVVRGLDGRFLVLSGGPGMGKTYTVRALLAALWLDWRRKGTGEALRVALLAPTGKAAARMREALNAGLEAFIARVSPLTDLSEFGPFVAALEPRTIHRALAWTPVGAYPFRRNATSPLDAEVVIIDEVSMVSSALMAAVVNALGPSCRLICIGDRHQLASVEPGSVLADISSPASGDGVAVGGAPLCSRVVQLNRNFRFSSESGIGRFASLCIRESTDSTLAVEALLGGAADVVWHESSGALSEPALDRLVDGYRNYLLQLSTAEPLDVRVRSALAAFDTFRVLAPHRRGRNGVIELNRRIVERLAERRAIDASVTDPDWIGRPILITENDYELNLVNGDTGLIVPSPGDPGRRRAAFVRADGSVELVATSLLPARETAFAMTVHKSQGSEYDRVALVLPDEASPVMTRELIYTAVTRARTAFEGYGPSGVLRQAMSVSTSRSSGLRDRLWGPSADRGSAG